MDSIKIDLHGQGGIGVSMPAGSELHILTNLGCTIEFTGESPASERIFHQAPNEAVVIKIPQDARPGLYAFRMSGAPLERAATEHLLFIFVGQIAINQQSSSNPDHRRILYYCRDPREC